MTPRGLIARLRKLEDRTAQADAAASAWTLPEFTDDDVARTLEELREHGQLEGGELETLSQGLWHELETQGDGRRKTRTLRNLYDRSTVTLPLDGAPGLP